MDRKSKYLLAAVDRLEPDMLDFACRLVAEPSTLRQEAGVLAVMEAELAKCGLKPQRVPIDPEHLAGHPGFAPVPWSYEGRYNVVAIRDADGSGGRSALFNGHLDVVPPEPLEPWDTNPFAPVIKDGWLYGRGAGDMKAGVAAMTYALKAVEAAGMGLAAQVTIETVIEEECSGNGALACRHAGFAGDAVLIPEPFGPTILTAQVGVAWFKFTIKGVSKHALETHSGVNAIEKCYPVLAELRQLEKELNAAPHPAFAGIQHPVNLNIGVIKGGHWPSTVPATAEVHCRLGLLPGMSFAELQTQVQAAVDRAAASDPWLAANPPAVEFYGFRSEGHVVAGDLPAFQVLSRCHRLLSGEGPAYFVSTATTDLRAFVHYGRGQATCFGPVAANIHAENERVDLKSVVHTARVYALFLAEWCGLVE